MSNFQRECATLNENFEQVRSLYNEASNENESLQSYIKLLQSILNGYKIDYPSFDSDEEIDF